MAKKTIFICRDDFPSITYELLKEKFELVCWDHTERLTKNELIKNIKGKFGVLCMPYRDFCIDKDAIEAAGSCLKVVSTWSVGYDHLDVEELKKHGIKIGFAPVLTEAIAEHAVSILLTISRQIMQQHECILNGEWAAKYFSPFSICGFGLHKSTVGIIGCGRIGLSVLEKLKAFRPNRIFYYSRTEKIKANDLGGELKPLDYVIKESDFIILVLPLSEKTRKIINRERINSMKSNAIFVNIGRGDLVDEEALAEALQNNRIAGAGLDVFTKEPLPVDSPLLRLKNVVLTPHLASATHQCRTAMAEISAKNILAVLNNEEMPFEL